MWHTLWAPPNPYFRLNPAQGEGARQNEGLLARHRLLLALKVHVDVELQIKDAFGAGLDAEHALDGLPARTGSGASR